MHYSEKIMLVLTFYFTQYVASKKVFGDFYHLV